MGICNICRSSKQNTDNSDDMNISKVQKLYLLGRGAYGIVHLVYIKDKKQLYAMKEIEKSKLRESCDLERYFRSEKNILAKIHHPFIVKLKYAFQNFTHLFLVMEYLPGGNLRSLLKHRGFLEEKDVKNIAIEIILALEYLHSNNIIYRDLKPENILLDKNGHIRLADFGLSKEMMSHQITNSLIGTPCFIAPEILNGIGHNKMVDYFSLGVTLFELLMGRLPFSYKKREASKQVSYNYKADISAEVKSFLDGLLRRDPAHRLGQTIDSIKNHPWLCGTDWDIAFSKQLEMVKPQLENSLINIRRIDSTLISSTFDIYPMNEWEFPQVTEKLIQNRKDI